jgi:hypothetical protein
MARKPVTVNFEITNQSFQKLDKIMKKFNLEWDSKVYKSVGKLNNNLDLVAKRISTLTVAMNKQRGANAGATGGVQFDTDKFFNELGDSMDDFTKAMKKAAQEISNLQISVKGAGSASEEEKINRMESLANADVAEGQRKVFMQKERHRYRDQEAAQDHRLKQERLLTRHLMSMFGGGAVGGGLGLIMKEITGGLGEKFTKASATQDYLKTEEGQNVLQFQKAAQGSKNPLGQFGSQISSEWADKGVTQEGIEKSGGIMGRAKSWMGRRVEGAQEGDMTKMMGGKKGMLMAGGALAGVAILKKAISLGIESSPMMQQMLKLWKFGIMMIFRPIGDFFGFFLRPIFVMLLRKFIIPFYQEYLPLMQTMGHDIGEKVVAFLDKISGFFYKEDAAGQLNVTDRYAGLTKEESFQQALMESMQVNKTYWDEFLGGLEVAPEWVTNILKYGDPKGQILADVNADEGEVGNVPLPSMTQGGAYIDPAIAAAETDRNIKVIEDFIETASSPYVKLRDDLIGGGTGSGEFVTQGGMLGEIQPKVPEFDLTTSEGLAAAQAAQAAAGGTTWNINQYTTIVGPGTEEVNKKVEEESEKNLVKLEEKVDNSTKEIVRKYGKIAHGRGT